MNPERNIHADNNSTPSLKQRELLSRTVSSNVPIMFKTLNLFKDLPCPQGQQCRLPNCYFSHESRGSAAEEHIPHATQPSESASQPLNGAAQPLKDDSIRVLKKRKIENGVSFSGTSPGPPRREPTSPAPELAKESSDVDQVASRLLSTTRAVSPPPSTRSAPKPLSQAAPAGSDVAPSQPQSQQLPPRQVTKESLNPRMLSKAPASHAARSAILKKLHAAITSLNERLAEEEEGPNKCFVLNKDELITMALDEEEKVAKESPGLYSNVIKLRIVKLTRMSLKEWSNEVLTHLNARYYKTKPVELTQKPPKSINTGLTAEQEITLATKLVTPLKGLEEFGYITTAPTEKEIEIAKKGVDISKGWEQCDRCAGRFQVFPGRREDGALANNGPCTYHPARPVYPVRNKTDRVIEASEKYYPCCGESVGTSSAGCTKWNTHVFKGSERKRLASTLQFETTPVQPDKGRLQPVCIDCEMGYTTLGFELIRLTAVSWPEGRDLLDVLVKPMGEIMDLNSRYSGVFPEHFASAKPYTPSGPVDSSVPKEGEHRTPLQVVESPAAARKLLFDLIQPDTPVIGHAIDNDLNVLRIIHPTVIDTVLLYPHPSRLPLRMSLKTLARKVLERDIQTGGDRGHDSREDSIATGDLVRVRVGELWKRLKAKGWLFQGDVLVPPPGLEASDVQRVVSELGARQKRKTSGVS